MIIVQNNMTNNQNKYIWDMIWNPSEDDLLKIKILFYVSIPAVMIIPLVLNIISKSNLWNLLALFWLFTVIVLRITVGIRRVIRKKQHEIIEKTAQPAVGG
jgi:ABC-type nitrate/sulfonate/bicarbonate transport system permease component